MTLSYANSKYVKGSDSLKKEFRLFDVKIDENQFKDIQIMKPIIFSKGFESVHSVVTHDNLQYGMCLELTRYRKFGDRQHGVLKYFLQIEILCI